MNQHLTDSRLANLGANAIHQAFKSYRTQFDTITDRAKKRFENRDWHGMQADAARRLALYRDVVDQVVLDVRQLLDDRVDDKLVWVSMKAVYSGLIGNHDDWELAETFFNSVTRRIFATVGVDPQIEFVDTDFDTPPTRATQAVYRTYGRAASTAALVRMVLEDCQFDAPFQDLERDIQLVTDQVETHLRTIGALRVVDRTEMVKSAFYRSMGAYLVGRLFSGSHLIPLVLALLHTSQGIVVDAILLDEDKVSILFSFARSYFHVEVERPYDLIYFLKSIIPRKRVAELYISIGYNKHGKTELYRDLLRHLYYSNEKFQISRGQRGMVMTVFTMPNYDIVFKLIKDHFNQPKDSTRAEVMEKYELVFKRDRAGRLVDAQEFEHLKFDRSRFSAELLDELRRVAPKTVSVQNEHVVIGHAYVERRVIPLDIYVREANKEAARAAVIDYGRAIKDLAASNIFPGDLLLKNFGVTRHGRVVFYDYDELCLLTTCHFRVIPASESYEQELASEPWFHVNENDIFPEEFRKFLGLPDDLRAVFEEYHADLYGVAFWRQCQARLQAGEIIHIFPYTESDRLHGADEVIEVPGTLARQ